MRAAAIAAAAAALVLGAARPAAAHPLDIGYLRLAASGATIEISLDVEVSVAAHLIDLDPRAAEAAVIAARAGELADATLRRTPLETELGPCTWATAATAVLHARTASLSAAADCPSGARTVRWELPFLGDARLASTFQLLVKGQLGGEEYVTTVDRDAPQLALDKGARLGFTAFVWSGIQHIGATPGEWHDADGWKLPDGLDHILFLLALMLAGGTLLQLVGIATGFTLGHSITLAISGLGIARPPASVIEPLIALSIALVAAQALLGKRERHRWQVAAGFGLIHGFGFAGALNELDLPAGELVAALFGYNAGVELGQVAIVLVIAPLVLLVQRRPRAHRAVVAALAASIFLAGMYWFIQRLFG